MNSPPPEPPALRVAFGVGGAAIIAGTLALGAHTLGTVFAGASTGTEADVAALPVVLAMSVAVFYGGAIGLATGGAMLATALSGGGPRR